MKSDQVLITTYDLKRLFLRLRATLKTIALCSAALTLLVVLFQQPKYLAEATLKHNQNRNEFSSFTKGLLKDFVPTFNETPTFSIIRSHRVLKEAIFHLGLQVKCNSTWLQWLGFLARPWMNVCSQLGLDMSKNKNFEFHDVIYSLEKDFDFIIRPLNAKSFEILDQNKRCLTVGVLGEMTTFPQGSLKVTAFPEHVIINKLYRFTLVPSTEVIKKIKKRFEIKEHKIDKNIFILTFDHEDRKTASDFLNQAMLSYQDYFRKENEEVCQKQVHYLEKRHQEMVAHFDEALREHVSYLKENIEANGFLGFASELDSLAETQSTFSSKLFDVDLDLKRLKPEHNKLHHAEQSMLTHNLAECDLEKNRLEALSTLPKPVRQESEFDAVTLECAQGLYLDYTKKIDENETALRQLVFLRESLQQNDFEVSSLTSLLNDSVSATLINNASSIALKLRDGENRTAREQERLREELTTQKMFLVQHLTHTIELKKLQTQLLSHRIGVLKEQSIALLDREKMLLKGKMGELSQKMAVLPEKWHRENLLRLKKELSARVIEWMTQLVETKSLNQKLFEASSTPLDFALPPKYSDKKSLILFPLLIAFIGCFVYYAYHLSLLLIRGFPVSHHNLRMAGLPSYGTLSPYCASSLQELGNDDLEILRSLSSAIASAGQHTCAVVLTGKNIDWTTNLAELISLSGLKVLLVHYVFDSTVRPHHVPGLWQYLQGEEQNIPIRKLNSYDELSSGGTTRFAAEMITHPQFHALIQQLKSSYDIVLVHSNASPATAEARLLTKIADTLVVATCEESLEDLSPYMEWASHKARSNLSFVCFN